MLFMASDIVCPLYCLHILFYFTLFLPEMIDLSSLQKYLIKFLSFYIL